MLSKYTISERNGFSITSKAYFDFIKENDLQTKISHLLGSINYLEEKSLIKSSKQIRKLITNGKMSKELIEEVFREYSLLSGVLQSAKVNIQLTENENIIKLYTLKGEATLLIKIKDLWSSLFESQLIKSTKDLTISNLNKNVEIIVQKAGHQSLVTSPQQDQRPKTSDQRLLLTATRVYVNLDQPDLAEEVAKRQVDGIGLLKAEFIMANIGVHPKEMLRLGKRKEYIEKLAEGLSKFAKAFSPRPVIYRTSDFKTDEYRHLKGGQAFEQIEANPMLGFRGVFRYIHDPEVFNMELEAIKKVREKLGYKNLWIMLPFVRTVEDLVEVKKLITASGLYRNPTFKIWMMVEIPSNVILLDKFVETGIDGLSIGLDVLTMLTLGADRDNTEISKDFSEENDAVLWAIERVIKIAHKYHITSSLCGRAASYPKLLEHLVRWGVTSVSVNPDAIIRTRQEISEIEKRLISLHKG